jgi:pimeloyl-ACP methyl ester carboxylesterase
MMMNRMAGIVAARPASPAHPGPLVVSDARGARPGTRRRLLQSGLAVSAAALGVPLGGCAWLVDKESQLALRPTPGRPARLGPDEQLFKAGDERWLAPVRALDGSAQQLALWWLPQAEADAPTLLYLHGTFRNLYQNLPKIDALRALGFAVLAVDYRGWGDSTAIVPDEASISADAAVAWAELRRRQPQAALRVLYGHSMGGAVAVRLAAGLQAGEIGALVLESTFTRMPDVASAAGWVGRVASWMTSLEFDSLSRIGSVKAPLLMLHGAADTTVPVELGRRLRDAAPAGVRWVELPGGTHSRLHSDAPGPYGEAFRTLIHQLKTRAAPSAG